MDVEEHCFISRRAMVLRIDMPPHCAGCRLQGQDVSESLDDRGGVPASKIGEIGHTSSYFSRKHGMSSIGVAI